MSKSNAAEQKQSVNNEVEQGRPAVNWVTTGLHSSYANF
jgi:hypothetical protein